MKPKITTKQLFALTQLLQNLKDFHDRGFGSISNIDVMTYVPEKGSIFIKYEKTYSEGGEMAYDYRIAKISNNGEISFIDEKFKDMFERSAFLSECVSFNIEDKNSYEKID